MRGTMGRQLDAVRVVFTTRSLRDCQLAVALVRTADLAQLVAVSAFLFGHGGLGSVAAYGVVRTVAPAIGVPVVAGGTARVRHGQMLQLLANWCGIETNQVDSPRQLLERFDLSNVAREPIVFDPTKP